MPIRLPSLLAASALAIPLITLAAHTSTAAASGLAAAQSTAARPWVQVSGNQLVAAGKPIQLRGVNLGNWLLQEDFLFGLHGTHSQMRAAIDTVLGKRAAIFWDEYEEQFFTDADAAWLQARGFNLLRVPFNQNRLEDPNHPGRYDKAALARIDRLIERCARHGIYVLLDLHAVTGGQSRENYADATSGEPLFWAHADLRERATRLWEFLARRYRDNPAVAGYDLINEPHTEGRTHLLTSWLRTTVARVRAIDTRHVVWLSGDEWGAGLVGLEPQLWKARQLAFQFHIYPTWTYPWAQMDRYPATVDGVRYDAAWLRQRLAGIAAFGRHHPVLLGETGFSINGNSAREALMQSALTDFLALAEQQRWSWAQWTYKDIGQMGMVSPRRDTAWQQLVRSEAAQAERHKLAGLIPVRGAAGALPQLPALIRSLADTPADVDQKVVGTKVRRALDELLSRAISRPMARMNDDELRALARSFSLANCEENNAIVAPFAAAAKRIAP